MERTEWLLLVTVKCKLLAMGCGFTMAISQAPFSGGFVLKLLHFNSLCHPRDVRRSELSRSPVAGILTREVTVNALVSIVLKPLCQQIGIPEGNSCVPSRKSFRSSAG
jgi:hypothetical protein